MNVRPSTLLWTRRQLLTAYDMAARNARLADIGRRVGHSADECDQALWAVLCTETVTQALERINGQGAGGVMSVPRVAQ